SGQGFQGGPDVDSNSRFNEIGAGYFATMGVPLMSGREFTAGDGAAAPKVAIVNEEFVKKFNLGHDAVGKMMGSGSGYRSKQDTMIVGVAQNAKYSEVKRMALGAAPGRVRSMVLKQVGWMTAVGGVIGLAGAVALGRGAESLLFDMKGADPFVLTLSAVALSLVAMAAGLVPAHRASRVDP